MLVWRRHVKSKYKMVKTSTVQKWYIPEIGVEKSDREEVYFSSLEQDSTESQIHAQMFSKHDLVKKKSECQSFDVWPRQYSHNLIIVLVRGVLSSKLALRYKHKFKATL